MTTSANGPWPGRFVRHDLMTEDAARAQAFYCALFGWKIEERQMPGFLYRRIVAGPGPIGGIVEEQHIPASHWMPYIAVADVEAACTKARQLGGSQCMPPCDIPQLGRFAVLGDPQGGVFSVYKGLPASPGADPDVPVPGRVCWNELWTSDPEGALRFYRGMFGWQDRPKDIGPMGTYHVQVLGHADVGGIMRNPQPMPTSWSPYFLAPDLEASTQKAAALGARVCVGPTPIPDVGRFSLLADPTGAMFSLFQPHL